MARTLRTVGGPPGHRQRGVRRWAVRAPLVCLAVTSASCASTISRPPSTSISAPATSSPAPSTTISSPAGGAVPGGFLPGSVTFVSTTTGFALGVAASCPAGSCVALVRTTDGGSTWVGLAAPPAAFVAHGAPSTSSLPGVSEVRFADPLDGWAFGPALFATHDGALTWQSIVLGASVVSLETSAGSVFAVVSPCRGEADCPGPLQLEQAPAVGGGFVTVRTGPSVQSPGIDSPDLSLHAPVGFAVLGSGASLYATENLADPNGWNAFADPCASTGLPLTSLAAPDPTTLYSLCTGNGAMGSTTKDVVVTDGGKSTLAGAAPLGGDGGTLTATASGVLVIASASGASSLYRSTDGGHTWSTAETYDDGGAGFNDLGFTTTTQGVVVHGLPGPGQETAQLLMTHDAGATWQVVPIG